MREREREKRRERPKKREKILVTFALKIKYKEKKLREKIEFVSWRGLRDKSAGFSDSILCQKPFSLSLFVAHFFLRSQNGVLNTFCLWGLDFLGGSGCVMDFVEEEVEF